MSHAFTIDVEGFAESNAQSVAVDPRLTTPAACDREIAHNLNVALDLLAEHGCRATMFFLGRIGKTAPALVRRAAEAGHEIGCHSHYHLRITGQTPAQFRSDLTEARARLQDASGQEVIGFRAPDFSIGAKNRWAFDVLKECGFRYDSSVVPTQMHDVYGMADVPERIFRWPNGLVEFPLPVMHIRNMALPVGGGGYFRLYPLWLTRRHFMKQERAGVPATFYIHPYEIGGVAPRLPGLSASRRFRHYVRLGKGQKRLGKLLGSVSFCPMQTILKSEGFLTEYE